MLSFIKRVSGFGPREDPAAVQPSINPASSHLVVTESEDYEDGYAQVSVRRMTYAEVAHIGMRSYVQTAKQRPAVEQRAMAVPAETPVPEQASAAVARSPTSIDAESDDLYGDLVEQVYHPPRKGFKRQRPKVYV